jgi:hypothetical protein
VPDDLEMRKYNNMSVIDMLKSRYVVSFFHD